MDVMSAKSKENQQPVAPGSFSSVGPSITEVLQAPVRIITPQERPNLTPISTLVSDATCRNLPYNQYG